MHLTCTPEHKDTLDRRQSRPRQYAFILNSRTSYVWNPNIVLVFMTRYMCSRSLSQSLNYLLRRPPCPADRTRAKCDIWNMQPPITDCSCYIGHIRYLDDVASGVESYNGGVPIVPISSPAMYTTCSRKGSCSRTRVYHRFIELIIS